jgi:hypothetical protein
MYSDSFPKGHHLVMVEPGRRLIRYNIDPDYVALTAAAEIVRDRVADAIYQASRLRPRCKDLTKEQLAAWQQFIDVMGEEGRLVDSASANDVTEEVIAVLKAKVDKLLNTPSVRRAYERFRFVSELAKEHDHGV